LFVRLGMRYLVSGSHKRIGSQRKRIVHKSGKTALMNARCVDPRGFNRFMSIDQIESGAGMGARSQKPYTFHEPFRQSMPLPPNTKQFEKENILSLLCRVCLFLMPLKTGDSSRPSIAFFLNPPKK
jgi:hypothetical protein